MKRLFLLIIFLVTISYVNPVKSQFLPPISFNNFFKIASEGDLQGLKNAQRRGLNINSINSNGDTAICVAIKQKNYLAYRTLLRAGAKSNPDCIEKIPEYSHKSFLNNYNKQYNTRNTYLSPNKKWQSFLIGAGVAGGVGAALAGGGGGGGGSSSSESDVSAPSYDNTDDKEKCELDRCAEGCYTNITCKAGEYCKQHNDCGGCEQCEKLDQCLVNECAEGCYTNIICPTGQKCSKTNNCNGCEECEAIPVCNTSEKCNHSECYIDLDIPNGYECTKYNDCGGCEQYAPINGCDVVTEVTYNPISHHCSKYYETCNSKCQEIKENPSYEVRAFEKCVDGYLINVDGIDKCFQKELARTECEINPNFQECESGYIDETTGKCYSCIINKDPIPCKAYESCKAGWEDSNGTCYLCEIVLEKQDCDEKIEQCNQGYYDSDTNTCYECIINTETICTVNSNFQKCADGYTDENGACHSCEITGTECTLLQGQACASGFMDEETNKCYKCINDTIASNDTAINNSTSFTKEENVDIKTIGTNGSLIDEKIKVTTIGFRANSGKPEKDIDCDKCKSMDVYNALNNDGTITLNSVADNVIGLHSYSDAYNASVDTTGKITINNSGKFVFGIYAIENAYNASGSNSKGTIVIEDNAEAGGYIYGMYSHTGTAINSNNQGLGYIKISNTSKYQNEIFGIFNGSMSNNIGENSKGIINITDTLGSKNIYGIYNGDMTGANDEIEIQTTRIGYTQTVIGLSKNDEEITKGNITIVNDYYRPAEASSGDKVIGIKYTGTSKVNASDATIDIYYGLYDTTGIASSAPVTLTPTISIYSNHGNMMNTIYGVDNQLNTIDSPTLTIKDILIDSGMATNIAAVNTNNPNIKLNGDISIKNIESSPSYVYGIKYDNLDSNKSLNLMSSLNYSVNIDIYNGNATYYGMYLDGLSELTANSSNNIPINITKKLSLTKSENSYALYLKGNTSDNLSNAVYFTNNGTIKSVGNGIGINNAKVKNTESITASLDGININGGIVNNFGEITANRGIYSSGGLITNSGKISATTSGINAAADDTTNSYSITNSGNLYISGSSDSPSYGIWASNYNKIEQTTSGTISGGKYGIYTTDVANIINSGKISATTSGIDAFAEDTSNSYSITNSGILYITNSAGYGIFAYNYNTVNHTADGTISGGKYGIYAEDVDSITSKGKITTSKYGIYAKNVNTIESTGSIQASNVGVYNTGNGTGNITIGGSIGDTTMLPNVGVYSDSSQSITINSGSTVKANTIGIYAKNGNVTNNGTIDVSSNATEMYGILGLNDSASPTTITNNGDIYVKSTYSGSSNIKLFGIYAGDSVNVVNKGNIEVNSTGDNIGSASEVVGIYLAEGSTLNNSGSIKITKTDDSDIAIAYGIVTDSKIPTISASDTNAGYTPVGNTYDGLVINNSPDATINGYKNVGILTENDYPNYMMNESLYREIIENNIVIKYFYQPNNFTQLYNHTGNEIGILLDTTSTFIHGLIREYYRIDPTIDITSLIDAAGASISTTGLFETDMPLTLSTLGLRKFGVGKDGTISAPEISGDVTAETSIIEDGFATTYTNEESFIGDTSDVNIVSASALFDAEIVEKENNTSDIKMTMKPFSAVVENESVAEYLQNNYAQQNNEALFRELKSFETNAQINNHLNKELGLSLFPNFAQENLQIFRSLNSLIIDDMFSKNLTDERILVGYDYLSQDRKSKGYITGYENSSNSSYFLADIKLDKNSRFGAGMSITKFDSDYDDNSSRDETFVSALASYMHEFKPNLKYAGVARLGYGFGDYDRNTSNNSYKANLHDIVYGLGNQIRYAYDMKYFILEPQIEFNVSGYYQRNMKEQIKNNSLKIASTNNLSVEAGVGLYASKSAKFNEWTNLKARLGAGYYREFAEPYHDMKISLRDMNGYYKTDASPIFDRNRYLLNADVNLDWRQFNFYMRANWFIENDDTAIINAGIKYNF